MESLEASRRVISFAVGSCEPSLTLRRRLETWEERRLKISVTHFHYPYYIPLKNWRPDNSRTVVVRRRPDDVKTTVLKKKLVKIR